MTARVQLALVRHGEPEEWARGKICGRLDPGLSAFGLRQAESAADQLAMMGLLAIYASPRRRALSTAEAIAARTHLPIEVLDDLREIDFGELEGLTFEEARARHAEVCRIWVERTQEVAFPGGESFAAMRLRVLAARTTILERHATGAVAVVAHAGSLAVLASFPAGEEGAELDQIRALGLAEVRVLPAVRDY